MNVVLLVVVTALMGAPTSGAMFKGTLEFESGTVPPLLVPPLVAQVVLAAGAFAMVGIDAGKLDGENSEGGGDDGPRGTAAEVARPRDE